MRFNKVVDTNLPKRPIEDIRDLYRPDRNRTEGAPMGRDVETAISVERVLEARNRLRGFTSR